MPHSRNKQRQRGKRQPEQVVESLEEDRFSKKIEQQRLERDALVKRLEELNKVEQLSKMGGMQVLLKLTDAVNRYTWLDQQAVRRAEEYDKIQKTNEEAIKHFEARIEEIQQAGKQNN